MPSNKSTRILEQAAQESEDYATDPERYAKELTEIARTYITRAAAEWKRLGLVNASGACFKARRILPTDDTIR